MHIHKISALVATVVMACSGGPAASRRGVTPNVTPQMRVSGDDVQKLSLLDTSNNTVASVRDLRGAKGTVIIFTGMACPVALAYEPVLATIYGQLQGRGIRVLVVNSNYAELAAEVQRHTKEAQLPFSIYKDVDGRLANAVGATRTSEAVLLDSMGQVVYRGRIDDRFAIGVRRSTATKTELPNAIDAMLRGRPIAPAMTEASGCFISKPPVARQSNITYADVAPIFNSHCVSCHSPGEVAPMPLRTYGDVAAWADTIKEVLEQRRMPPFAASGADPRYGDFLNDKGPSAGEKAKIVEWIAAGAPRGGSGEPIRAETSRSSTEEWHIGKPDVILAMPKVFEVPAAAPGGIPYQKFQVYENTGEEKWVEAVEIRPTARSVVHHANVYMVYPKASIDKTMMDRYASFAPGRPPLVLPTGLARRLPKGAKLLLEMHYAVDGFARTDRTSVAIRFAAEKPKREVRSVAAGNQKIDIPPFAPNVEIVGSYTFGANARLYSFTPHMHVRGKDFRYDLLNDARSAEIMLLVPKYDFEWQHVYVPREIISIPKGAIIRAIAHFDNSPLNQNNPDPSARVVYGEQTWDEMMFGFLDVIYDLDVDSPVLADIRKAEQQKRAGGSLSDAD